MLWTTHVYYDVTISTTIYVDELFTTIMRNTECDGLQQAFLELKEVTPPPLWKDFKK